MADFEERIEQLKDWVDHATHIAFFGGAGVSTESGIPDFRSKDGLYNQHDVNFDMYQPEYLLSHDCLFDKPKVFYEYYRQKMDVRGIKPNVTHYKLAELEAAGKKVSVITQNIDGLHQLAGSKRVYEIHGATSRHYCARCHKPYSYEDVFDSKEPIPYCSECGKLGMIRPDVTLYGEQLPYAFTEAIELISEADVMIIAGTSLTVYPAANLIQYYRGSKLVIINRDPTSRDAMADLIFHENMGEVFSRL